jgi:hypothetical protein
LNSQSALRTASVNHHLAHTLVHGAARNEVSPIRWVLDASLLLKHQDLDWQSFLRNSAELGWSDLVAKQLLTLQDTYGLGLPGPLSRGAGNRHSLREKIVDGQHVEPGGYMTRAIGAVTITRPEQYRSIGRSEKKPAKHGLLVVAGLTVLGEAYRLLHRLFRSRQVTESNEFSASEY